MTGTVATRLVLVRHGETTWSAAGKHTGITDVPLTDRGRRMAESVGHALREQHFDAVYCSPLQRARETCTLAGLDGQMKVLPDLREWNYGDFEGLATSEIRERLPGWTIWQGPVPGGETLEDVGRRCDRILAGLRHQTGGIVLFGHGHALRMLGARWLGLPPGDGRLFALSAAAISELGHEHDQPVLALWNSTAHLQAGS